MFATITVIELKSPFKIFALSFHAMKIVEQLKITSCIAHKATGFWTKHYTMTLWDSKESLTAFARSGAHLTAMKLSASLAKEIYTLTIETDSLPNWKEAKERLLKEGKLLKF